MSYTVKTSYPKEEQMDNQNQKYTTTRKQELVSGLEQVDVITLYNEYLRQGYDVNVKIKASADENDEDAEVSPFEIAQRLTMAGIDYKASLKVKNSGSYDDILPLIHLIEHSGFAFNVAITLKINDTSTVNIDHEDTWMDADNATYKVTPKASSTDINDLKPLYDALEDASYEPTIDLTPKKQSADDDDFETQLSAYPDGAEVDFTLKDSE